MSATLLVQEMLATAGIGNGTYTVPPGVDLEAANATAMQEAVAPLSRPGVVQDLGHGWSMLASQYTGDFGTNYGIRDIIASTGYLMLKAPNALYPSWSNSSVGSSGVGLTASPLSVASGEAILYDFVGGR